jgi:GSH-dependent disulfide-bond oxidoreductase
MIKVYAFSTPNSVRVPIALEELGLAYEIESVNVRKGEQKLPAYLALNPNGKVPAIVDPDGPGGAPFVLTESGAILIYLAEKTGRLIPSDPAGRARVFEQMFFHMTGIGPAFGQAGFFKRQASEQIPLAIARFQAEAERTLAVLELGLGRSEFVAGHSFTIADIAHFGWLWRREFAGIDFANSPNVARWYESVASRPAVSRAVQRVAALVPPA